MPKSLFRKPLLPSHYSVWYEPPDESGEEVLRIVSGRRSLKLKGRAFREFHQRVVPLLDGCHTVEEISEQTSDVFRPEDLVESLNMLGGQGILVEAEQAAVPQHEAARLAPQLNLFHELAPNAWDVQARLQSATVAVVGLEGAGAATALALAAAGIGALRLIDAGSVTAPDVYLSPFFSLSDVGTSRAAAVQRRIEACAPRTTAASLSGRIDSEDGIRHAIAGANFVVCCLDASELNLALKLNRACIAERTSWIACSLGGLEVTIGPAMQPGDGPCYMCYRMRAVACTNNPVEAFAFERYLDRRRRDESGRRENLVFGAGLAANYLGLEVVKTITGLAEPALIGRILTIELMSMSIQRHTVLRKPWCPACFAEAGAAHAG